MKRACAHATVADISDRYNLFLLHASRQKHTRHHRNHVTQVRYRADEAFLQVTEMYIEIAAPRGSAGLGHILREDIARSNPFHQDRAEIADQRRNEILWLQRVGSPHRRRFLSERAKNTTHNFGLPVQIYKSLFNQPRKLEITIQIEQLIGLEGSLDCAAQWFAVKRFARGVFREDPRLMTRLMAWPATATGILTWDLFGFFLGLP